MDCLASIKNWKISKSAIIVSGTCPSFCFPWLLICDILIIKLRVTSFELISLRVAFIARVTSYHLFLLHELLFTCELRVTVYCSSYELLFTYELRVTVYCTSYELLFITRVTSYCLLHELQNTFCIRVTSYCSLQKLRVNLCLWAIIKIKMIKLFMLISLW